MGASKDEFFMRSERLAEKILDADKLFKNSESLLQIYLEVIQKNTLRLTDLFGRLKHYLFRLKHSLLAPQTPLTFLSLADHFDLKAPSSRS